MDILDKIDERLILENKLDKLKDLEELIEKFNEFISSYPSSQNIKKMINILTMEKNHLAAELGNRQ